MPVPVLEAASAEVGSSVNNVIMTRNADMILVLSVFKVGSSLLSFRDNEEVNEEEHRLLGDIYISVDKAKSQALEYGHSFKREICFLAVHGFLHLLGYDHMNKHDEEIMFSKQELILNEANITK